MNKMINFFKTQENYYTFKVYVRCHKLSRVPKKVFWDKDMFFGKSDNPYKAYKPYNIGSGAT